MAARNRGGSTPAVPEVSEVVDAVESTEETIMVTFQSTDGTTQADAHVSADGVFSTTDLNSMGAALRTVATQKADRQSVVLATIRQMMVEAPSIGDSILNSVDAIVAAAKTPRAASGPRTTEAERIMATFAALQTAADRFADQHGFSEDDVAIVPDVFTNDQINDRADRIIETATFTERVRTIIPVTMDDVVTARLLTDGEKLTFSPHSAQVTVNVSSSGVLTFSARGVAYDAASPAAEAIANNGVPVNGLDKLRNADGVTIGSLRFRDEAIAAYEARTATEGDDS